MKIAIRDSLKSQKGINLLTINPHQVTPQIRTLFREDEPQVPRCFNVLDGVTISGRIITDSPELPTWAAVLEPYDNSVYFGGAVDSEIISRVIRRFRRNGEVLVGMWLDDPRISLLPGDNYYDGRAIDFYNRDRRIKLSRFLKNLPQGYEIFRLDRNLILQTEWGPADVSTAGGLDAWEQSHFGFCLVKAQEIVAEATVGPSASNLYEPGVFTQEVYRSQGFGTTVSARLVQEVESIGGNTYWNCAKQNIASTAIARKLGYQVEKEYRVIAWSQS